MRETIILVAHGSRRAEANQDLVRLARQLAQRCGDGVSVRWAYLELAEPSIPQALDAAANEGAERVILTPVFLSAGRHVREDLQRLGQEFRRRFPHVDLRIAAPIGLHPKLSEIIWDRVREAAGAEAPSRERPPGP